MTTLSLNRPKRFAHSLLATGTCALIGVLLSSTTLAAPPSSISGKYKGAPDTSISDEFNAGRQKKAPNGGRWRTRADPPGADKGVRGGLNYIFRKNNVLHCIGNFSQKTAGGIVSRKAKKYGFYETRWRSEGFKLGKASPFHPSIWCANVDGYGNRVANGPGGNWLEIDFVEFEVGKLGWSSDAPARIDGNIRIAVTVPENTRGVVNAWNVHGLEYTPNFLQVWRKDGGTWKKIGQRVNFKSGNSFNETRLPFSTRTAGYWYIGNLWFTRFGTPDASERQNTKFMVDFFRFYPRK